MSWKVRRELTILFVLFVPAIASGLWGLFAYLVEGDHDELTLQIFVPAAITLWLFQFIVKTGFRLIRGY